MVKEIRNPVNNSHLIYYYRKLQQVNKTPSRTEKYSHLSVNGCHKRLFRVDYLQESILMGGKN